jgi:hypothetical protein
MFELDYKASNIRNAEKEYGLSFFDGISKVGSNRIDVTTLMFLYSCGGAADEDFDKDFKAGMQEVVLNIFEAIDDAGFLGEKLDIEAMKKELGLEKAKNSDSSTKSGETTKA